MSDSDPRPMPPAVQLAYKQPPNLVMLLETSVYSEADRAHVRDELLRTLIDKHGEAWVTLGNPQKGQRERTQSLTSRVASFRRNTARGVEFMLGVPDYGGPEETLPMLAQLMQPRWAQWWAEQRWRTDVDVYGWALASRAVLGQRQFAWLAAQYARMVIEFAGFPGRYIGMRAIEAA